MIHLSRKPLTLSMPPCQPLAYNLARERRRVAPSLMRRALAVTACDGGSPQSVGKVLWRARPSGGPIGHPRSGSFGGTEAAGEVAE